MTLVSTLLLLRLMPTPAIIGTGATRRGPRLLRWPRPTTRAPTRLRCQTRGYTPFLTPRAPRQPRQRRQQRYRRRRRQRQQQLLEQGEGRGRQQRHARAQPRPWQRLLRPALSTRCCPTSRVCRRRVGRLGAWSAAVRATSSGLWAWPTCRHTCAAGPKRDLPWEASASRLTAGLRVLRQAAAGPDMCSQCVVAARSTKLVELVES